MQLTTAAPERPAPMDENDGPRTLTDRPAPPRGRDRRRLLALAGLAVGVAVLGGASWAAWRATQAKPATIYRAEVVNTFPHDVDAFTQGLEFAEGVLYEGTGQYGHSELRKVQLETGAVIERTPLPDEVFGEGITVWKERIIQLTWQERIGFIFERATLKRTGRFRYAGEGWGLTHDATHLILSDGTATLRFLDPETYKVVRTLRVVTPDGRPVDQLNELEYLDGEILANIWNTAAIARISAETGRVVGWIDLGDVRPRQAIGSNAVLNGIAYEPASKRLFVTGKNWSELFEIRIVPAP